MASEDISGRRYFTLKWERQIQLDCSADDEVDEILMGICGGKPSTVPMVTNEKTHQKRNVIIPESLSEGKNYEYPEFPKSPETRDLIMHALDGSLVFSGLLQEQKEAIVKSMEECRVDKGRLLIEQGAAGDAFYVVESGRFDILVEGAGKVAETTVGGSFGELALIMNQPRAASVKATEDSVCWKIDRKPFRYFLASSSKSIIDEIYEELQSVQVLQGLPKAHLYKLAAHTSKEFHKAGSTIIKRGDVGDKFYMLQKGVVACTKIGPEGGPYSSVELTAGAHFGERAFTHHQPRACDVLAKTDTTLITLSGQDFEALLGSLRDALDKKLFVNVIRGLPKFRSGSWDWNLMYELLVPFELADGQSATFDDEFVSVQSGGYLDVACSTTVASKKQESFRRTVGPGEYVGEDFLCSENYTVVKATAKLKDLGNIADDDFETSARSSPRPRSGRATTKGKKVSGYKLSKATLAKAMEEAKEKSRRASYDEDPNHSMSPADFQQLSIGRTLGTGTFGRVKLATKSGDCYALKQLCKKAMVDMNQAESILIERQILKRLAGHPFVLRLYGTFQSRDVCYLVLEFVQGGELFSRVEGGVPEKEALFYAANVVDAFDHIHGKSIVYRDLKPENVLIDSTGYTRVVDFGFAKLLKPNPDKKESYMKTWTILGTPEYLSPECVLGKGYSFEVDLWAYGVLVYETLIGRSPFYAANPDDTMKIFRHIVAAQVKFPKKLSGPTEAFVRALLAKDLKDRLGCQKGAAQIKRHAVLKPYNQDWDRLRSKKFPAPYVPKLKDPTDTSKFDNYPEDMAVDRFDGDQNSFTKFGPYVDNVPSSASSSKRKSSRSRS